MSQKSSRRDGDNCMLKRIVIENYRSCSHTTFECHPHLSVLIGPNGSGKTNVLQAVMLLNKIAQEPGRVGHDHRGHDNHDAVPLRIRADFEALKTTTRLRASVSVRTDNNNRDKLISTQEKWSVSSPRRKPAKWIGHIAMMDRMRSDWVSYGRVFLSWSAPELLDTFLNGKS
jgi:ABC-type branched-subunit amino acid transport system ATPase component